MKRGAVEIRIGLGACGVASGGEPARAALEQEATEAGANLLLLSQKVAKKSRASTSNVLSAT